MNKKSLPGKFTEFNSEIQKANEAVPASATNQKTNAYRDGSGVARAEN
jgi:hypothetical protein